MSRSDGVPITPRVAVFYALGDVGSSLASACLAFYWLYFLIQVAGLSPLQAGVIHASGYGLSAAANLWAGRVLDRRFASLRRRCQLIAGLGVAMAALFALLWVLPPAPWRAAWYLGLSWAFHLVFALAYLAYLSLSAQLGASEQQRVDLSSYRFAGTMLLTVLVLALHGATAGRLDLSARLLLLAGVVAGCGALGSLVCGLGLRPLLRDHAPESAADRPASWSSLAAARPLRTAVAGNLAVWFMAQTTMVLTVFLCAAAGAADALVLLDLQVAIILAAGLTSAGVRRWPPRRVLALAALLWCVGAGLWQGAVAPYAAAACLGLGLGAATVLSWASVAEALSAWPRGAGRADARAYAGLSLLRDLVAAAAPMLAAALMTGRPVGSAQSGTVAATLLLVAGVGAAALVFSLSRPAAAAAGTSQVPT
ncbi:MFS transporter [Phenylobacterium sp. LjRoot219]|uniref:MFS transporter n=1 Tax=Phenylobacterium sp. LjRoot219 TaxID=3342283 RepID=UPI003ECDE945